MANYVIKEMPAGMGNGKKGRTFPKLQVHTEFDYDKVVELIHTNSPAFSQGTIRGVLDTLGVVLKNYLPMGHTMKIDNLGVFSLALPASRSPYTPEERLQRALQHIDKHGFITLQDYTNLNSLSRSTASRELSRLASDPTSGIQSNGSGSHKIWIYK